MLAFKFVEYSNLVWHIGNKFIIVNTEYCTIDVEDTAVDRWRLLEFSTKKYVLFTTYFMSSFQITWYFQRTL